MKVLIIEDEKHAADHIAKLIGDYDSSIEVIQVLGSVKKSVEWFNQNPLPDLLFMDIQLSDGLSFDIFKQCTITTPVIFTTAYDEYAIRAFKLNSIDYLLKPISPEELAGAIDKFKNIRQTAASGTFDLKSVDKVMKLLTREFKNRFLIKVGEHIRFIPVEDILYFNSLEKATFLQTSASKSYSIDYSLDDIESLIDPSIFFRISRKYIVSIESIVDIISFSNSRLKLKLKNCTDDNIIVSREKVQSFKTWLDK
jgi:two-component system, LytTR family, response regulator